LSSAMDFATVAVVVAYSLLVLASSSCLLLALLPARRRRAASYSYQRGPLPASTLTAEQLGEAEAS